MQSQSESIDSLATRLLGLNPGPAGALLLPSFLDDKDRQIDLVEKLASGLIEIDQEQEKDFERIRFFCLAARGDLEEALRALDNQESNLKESGEYSLYLYNRFVLGAEATLYTELQADLKEVEPSLLKAVAFLHGLESAPEVADASIHNSDDLVKAFLLSTRAHHRMESGDFDGALSDMETAAALAEDKSPVFAARLHGEWALSVREEAAYSERAVEHFEKALKLLDDTVYQELRAELALELGINCQLFFEGDKSKLLRAISAYQEALRYFQREGPGEFNYGLAQMNLGLVYLSMPMNDEAERLRPAIAIQALREALKVFTRDTNQKMWASATLNLANALQHVPSTHSEDNLWEAVALYQEILEVRDEGEEPLNVARVLANQGNALAHLGAFSRACPTLERARALFESCGEAESVAVIDEVLNEIEKRRSEIGNS